MFDKITEFIKNGNVPLREVLYRVILLICIISVSGTTVMTLVTNQPKELVIVQVALVVLMLVALLADIFFRIMDVFAVIILLLVNGVLFPRMFLLGGGLESAASLWMILGHVIACILLRGKRLLVVEGVGITMTIATYIYSGMNPEKVTPLPNTTAVIVDYIIGFTTVTVLSVILLYMQAKVADREREKIKEQKEEIERIGKSKDVFFASMSHEIRTPINTIIGLNEMNLREDISKEIAENCLNIQNAGKMLLSLINDILDLSKIETGGMEIVPVQYETGVLFSDVVNIIWVRATQKGLNFRIDISEEMPSMLFGDEVRIKQVLMNILNNAVKYTHEGEIVLTASSEVVDVNRVQLRISVSDTGIGIKKENLDSLFDTFQRVDQEKNRNIEGTGLGLSIAKQLMELMGGKITVDSIYTKGSTFTMIFEQRIVDATPLGVQDFTISNKVESRKQYKHSFEAPEARVLVVDDNEMNLMVAEKLLRATKVQVDKASSGQECLQLTQNNYYNVIFMDHRMPDMDGLETFERLRKQPSGLCKDTPVIALTANAGSDAQKLYKEKGFMGYLAKPINGALFEATLLRYLPKDIIAYSAELDEKEGNQDGIIHVFQKAGKKSIRITTDCISDIPKEWMEKLDIGCVYNHIHVGENVFRDTEEISADNLIEYMSKHDEVIHSIPADREEYEAFFASALLEADEVVHVTISPESGDAYGIASEAAEVFDNVHVIDSGHLSCGLGIAVLIAAQMAKQGATVNEIKEELAKQKSKIETTYIVPSVETLYRNGRIRRVAHALLGAFDTRMVLHLKKGKMKCKRLMVGNLAWNRNGYIRSQLRNSKKVDPSLLFLVYAGCSVAEREAIKKEVAKYVQFERIVEQKASASITSYCGPGTFGLMYRKK